jgi:hypothetical protein
MKIFKAKSLNPNLSDKQIERAGGSASFLSFERAIRETNELAGIKDRKVKGYYVTEEGITIIWE